MATSKTGKSKKTKKMERRAPSFRAQQSRSPRRKPRPSALRAGRSRRLRPRRPQPRKRLPRGAPSGKLPPKSPRHRRGQRRRNRPSSRSWPTRRPSPPQIGRDWSKTLFLPSTDFPMKAGLPEREPELLARWRKLGLYDRLREEAMGRPKFILHDGPPYANGQLHIGTCAEQDPQGRRSSARKP